MSKVTPIANPKEAASLKRGWTTGACATAATKAALTALFTGAFPDPVTITLPKGETPHFALSYECLEGKSATAGIVKDAGDDPDVTHGATILATVSKNTPGNGIHFLAGPGVGTVTKAGLPIGVGQAAINPVPRKMMREVIEALCAEHGCQADFTVSISVPEGEEMARQTWNPRLGIIGGISILGTTGIVHPFSCSAWIHSIHRGIDVCRANGLDHAIAATGSTSEAAANALYNLPDEALLDMGDFAGGLLKYLRNNPIDRLTLAGGFAKFTKLAQGAMDLHSGRSQVDMAWLAQQAQNLGLSASKISKIKNANTASEVLGIINSDIDIAGPIASRARQKAFAILRGSPVNLEVIIISREGKILARTGFDG